MRPELLHHRGGRLSVAELSALRLDGTLHEVGDAYMPSDLPETAAARALSLAPLLRAGLAASGPSAAWVHGAGDRPPPRHHARPFAGRRLRPPSDARLTVHESPVRQDDLVVIGGVRIVAVVETVVDLARTAHLPGVAPWLTALVSPHPRDAEQALNRLRTRVRMPGKRRAIRLLAEVYEDVTRYTS